MLRIIKNSYIYTTAKILEDERFDTIYYPDIGDGIAVAKVKG